MGLFSFLTENGRGCLAALAKDKLIYEVRYMSSLGNFLCYPICVLSLNASLELSCSICTIFQIHLSHC